MKSTDLVRKLKDGTFHLKCFQCSICKRELCTGEEVYLLGKDSKELMSEFREVKAQSPENVESPHSPSEFSLVCQADYAKLQESSLKNEPETKNSTQNPVHESPQLNVQISTPVSVPTVLPQQESPSISLQSPKDTKVCLLVTPNNGFETGVFRVFF